MPPGGYTARPPMNIPGYTLRGAIQSTGTNLLFHAVRDADGLLLILKTPMASAPGPRERERYRHEFGTREGGHGLGLHSSALAARMLGGRLSLESEGPGKGATATLELPLA
jgi:hypothetical protein